jgi:hypothetical protein
MKRKFLFVTLFLILIIFLCGCNGTVTPATDEAKVKSAINEYFLAINDQNWAKAKDCCIYGSDRYYATCTLEDLVNALYQYTSIVTITSFADIYNVSIIGNYADVYLKITILATAGPYYDSEIMTGYYYLQKVGNAWKIYDSSEL